MITDKMTALQKCIEWMRTGGETPRSAALHQKIARQAATELQDLEFNAARTKTVEGENKALTAENSQLRQQIKKNVKILEDAKQMLEHKQ